jgi:hypothetical protein
MSTTRDILVLVVAGLVIFDIYLFFSKGFDGTISWLIYGWAKLYPIIPFAFGVLAGHLFWSQVC